ncbi:MAG: hypothetical protein ACRDOH_36745 [Streptosporangiaceae bacterium]
MELKPVTPTAKGPASTFTGDVYVNPIYRGEEATEATRSPCTARPLRRASGPTRNRADGRVREGGYQMGEA